MEPLDHPTSRFAIDVLEGRVIAGELLKLACERHLRDLEDAGDRGFYFDCAAADVVFNFSGLLNHTKGPDAGKPIHLEPWQKFLLGCAFGWKDNMHMRRFRVFYNQVGKKNGKTTMTVVPAVYCMAFDGEGAPEIYCSATTRDQAGLLFKPLKQMLRASRLAPLFDITKFEILFPRSNGELRCLSRDGNSTDGINPHFAAKDEVHRWSDRELGEIIKDSMSARAQPMDWMITTAGETLNSYCGEFRIYSERILRGQIQDDRFFAFITEPDADCDIEDPRSWAMANPNLDVSKKSDTIRDMLRQALEITAQLPNFRRFHLNLWTEGAEAWLSDLVWMSASEEEVPDSDLDGEPCWVGLDLSSTVDMSAIVAAFRVEGRIVVKTTGFLVIGDDGLEGRGKRDKADYRAWYANGKGSLRVHNKCIDEDDVFAHLQALCDRYDVREIAYDRWGMAGMRKRMERAGMPIVDHGMGFASMSAPMKAVEKLVMSGGLLHGGDPVLRSAIGHVHRDEDPAEQIKPNKKKSTGRIDAAVAMIMAVGRAEYQGGQRKFPKEIPVV